MSENPDRWNPTTVKRFVKSFPTSACAALVETDAGKGYLKGLGNDEGPHILACELVGTRLAKWLGLSTFDFAIIQVTEDDEIPFHNGKRALAGPAFITRAESGETWSGGARQLNRLFNPHDISRLVVFDTWTSNCDRHSLPLGGIEGVPRINRNNVFLSEEAPASQLLLKAMDHTHCFSCGRSLSRKLCEINKIQDTRLFGCFPEFRAFLDQQQIRQAVMDLRRMDNRTANQLTEDIPLEWEVHEAALQALKEFVVRRANFVADTIEVRIWPQLELNFD